MCLNAGLLSPNGGRTQEVEVSMTKKDLMEYIEDLDDDCEVVVNVPEDKQLVSRNDGLVLIHSVTLPIPRDELGTIVLNVGVVDG